MGSLFMRTVGRHWVFPFVLLPSFFAHAACAAGWTVEKNEQDPFDKSKSTFIAMTESSGAALGVRCLDGTISLVVISGPSNASVGDSVDLKIVADNKDAQEEETAVVLSTTMLFTSVQFGDQDTLSYLQGVQKISVRYTLAGSSSTVSFSGGKSLANVLGRVRKACGLDVGEPTKPSTLNDKSAQPTPTVPVANTTCEGQFRRMEKSGDLAPDADEAGFMKWCVAQAKP